MENKIFTIYKMPRLSKNQKIRKDTQKLLDSIKSKLNPRTYTSFTSNIQEKRIDAVKRLADKLQTLKSSTETKITKKTFSKSIQQVKKQQVTKIQSAYQKSQIRKAKGNSIEIDNPKSGVIWKELKELKGLSGSVRISLVEDGNIIKTFVVDLDAKNSDIYFNLYHDVDYNEIFQEYPNARLIITRDENIKPQRIAQAFKQGTTNCLFLPIINWCEDKANNSTTEGTRKKYQSKLNVAKKLEEKYRESGVVKEELQSIADKLQINITIKLPFDTLEPLIETKCNKKQLTTFEYINTKLNHIDGFTHNEIINKKYKEISCEEMELMYNNLKSNGDYFIFKRNNNSISSISTVCNTYIQKQDFNEFTNEFKKYTGLSECYICDLQQTNLSQYIRASCNANLTIDFKKNTNDDDDDNEEDYGEYNCMDMAKAYKNVNKCNYYHGYLGKITDFRKTDKIVGIGIYTITNLVLPDKLKKLNEKMLIWKNGNPYPSPELEYLRSEGAYFDITEGCWGHHIDFDFKEQEWLNIVDDNREKTNTRWYAKFVGMMECYSEKESFYMNAEKDYIQNLISYLPEDKYRTYDDEVRFLINKDSNRHLTHIASFIKSYTRINMMEQLMSMEYNDVIRVCVDGIYYTGNYSYLNIFRKEEKEIKNNLDTGMYCSNYYHDFVWNCEAEFKPNYKRELHTGVGGGGKTHKQLTDKGNIKVKYFAPSWKLARKKAEEYNVKVDVWYNLLTDDPEKWGAIARNYNVLVIDEVSMMSNESKELIMERFNRCKIIMCGDIGFQLDNIGEGTPFKKELFDYYEEHNTNHRVKCKKLLFLLNKIRIMMASSPVVSSKDIRDYIINNFKKIKDIPNYSVNDMILTYTNKRKDEFTEMYKHLDKYYITENTQNYSNGEIVLHKPENTRCELRHAYTTHSIQGETTEHNLYIDITHINYKKMLYTALSRARYYDQIYLLV
tara:strand:+ start:1341 stop:4205 length:2865 start_codon:yes stop_codon:yes gene_type:complete